MDRHYRGTKAMVNESIIKIAERYVKNIPPDFGMIRAYLFGSCAKNENNNDSDIDIAIVLNSINDFFDTQLKLMKLRRTIDLRIEVHPFSISDFVEDNPLAYQIKKTGILLN